MLELHTPLVDFAFAQSMAKGVPVVLKPVMVRSLSAP